MIPTLTVDFFDRAIECIFINEYAWKNWWIAGVAMYGEGEIVTHFPCYVYDAGVRVLNESIVLNGVDFAVLETCGCSWHDFIF